MIGPEGLGRLQRAHVAVIGLGAVGSYAVEGLARAGVGRLRLVDFDLVRPSNINRQLYALQSTLGQPKAQLAVRRVRDINPDCQAEAIEQFVHIDTMDQVLAGPPDLVIDAIDAVTPKVELLTALAQRNIPVISCMGAAMRTDPASVRVGPLADTLNCPLAKQVRKRLRARNVDLNFSCVHSIECICIDPASIEPLNTTQHAVLRAMQHATQITAGTSQAPNAAPQEPEELLQRGRTRKTLGSLPTLTGIFGLTAANTAIQTLLNPRQDLNQHL